ncbi:MAG: TonB family protein [Terracidiphilus sp.]
MNAPTTLPADFGEWDSSEQPAAEPAAKSNAFDGFPGAVAAPKPVAKPATARVAVLPVAPKAPSPAPRRPAPVYAETEQVYQQPQPRAAKAVAPVQEPEGKKKTGLFAGIGIAAVVLIAGGGYGYLHMRSAATAPKATVASQTADSSANSLKPTPTGSTNSTTAATTTTATTTAAAATPDTTDTGRQSRADSEMMNHQLNAPSRISSDLKTLAGRDAPPAAGFGAADLGGSANPGGVFGTQSGPKVKVASPQKVSISAGIAVGLVMQKTPPVYPAIAKSAHVQGTVVIQATISKNGSVENPHVVSGPVMLRQAALDAVKTWRFRPYMLSNEPVDVETTVNVNFALGG